MKPTSFLTKIRLTYYFPLLFVIFLIGIYKLQDTSSDLYIVFLIVISFFLTVFLSSLISGSKKRIAALTTNIREESLVFYKLTQHVQSFDEVHRAAITKLVLDYLEHKNHNPSTNAGESEYQTLLAYFETNNKLSKETHEALIDNERNRTKSAMQLRNKVYSHEWLALLVLYAVMSVILCSLHYQHQAILEISGAVFGASSILLLLSLWKLNNLTHKRAWEIWGPFVKLISTKFQQLD